MVAGEDVAILIERYRDNFFVNIYYNITIIEIVYKNRIRKSDCYTHYTYLIPRLKKNVCILGSEWSNWFYNDVTKIK